MKKTLAMFVLYIMIAALLILGIFTVMETAKAYFTQVPTEALFGKWRNEDGSVLYLFPSRTAAYVFKGKKLNGSFDTENDILYLDFDAPLWGKPHKWHYDVWNNELMLWAEDGRIIEFYHKGGR